jgi:hypothetical protein
MTSTLSARDGAFGRRPWMRVLGMLAALAVLAGCGGGDPAPGNVAPVVRSPTLTVTMANGSGASAYVVTRDAPLTVTATLANGNGQAIANSLVQLALSFADAGTPAALALPSGITDANGRFTTTLVASSTTAQGGGTVTASAPNVTEAPQTSVSFQVQATTSPPVGPAIALALTDSQSGSPRSVLNRNTPLLATATLTDGSGRPIANTLVQYALGFTGGNAVAVLSPANGAGVTDATGKFAVQLIASSTTAVGTGTISVTAAGLTGVAPVSAPFQVTATTPPATAPIVSLALTDPVTGASRNTLTLASPLNATATVLDAAGRPVANSLVQFALTTLGGGSPVAVFTPASGNGITDATGKFTVNLQAAGLTTQGSGTIRATAVNEPNTPSASATYQVGATPIDLGGVTRTPEEIDPLQTSTIKVEVSGVPTTVPVNVRFTSPCAATGLASLPESVVTVNGVATAVYTDKGCSGTDTITISADGATSIQTTLNILRPPPIAIQFIDATPTDMSIFGVGGQPTSVVVFKVVNVAQQPVADVPVTLTLATDVSGVTLDGQGPTVTKRSAADGTVRVTVVAGTQAGPVRVLATANDGALKAISSLLSIHTSLPVQDRFSLAIETFNIECFDVDGTTTTFTVRAADRIGNPVPDGTTINFRTSGAAVAPTCRTSGGACSATFICQNPRPQGSGRGAVLAWAVGEENFFDTNGNNRFDSGEPFGDLGNAFVDNNLNGVFDPGSEEFIAYNPIGSGSCAAAPANAPSAVGVPDTCDGAWGLAHVRRYSQVVFSGSTANLSNVPPAIQLALSTEDSCEASFSFLLADPRGNPMPAGTTITATMDGGTATVIGSPVPNTLSATSVGVRVRVPAATVPGTEPPVKTCSALGPSRLLSIDVVTPAGFQTTRFVTVN